MSLYALAAALIQLAKKWQSTTVTVLVKELMVIRNSISSMIDSLESPDKEAIQPVPMGKTCYPDSWATYEHMLRAFLPAAVWNTFHSQLRRLIDSEIAHCSDINMHALIRAGVDQLLIQGWVLVEKIDSTKETLVSRAIDHLSQLHKETHIASLKGACAYAGGFQEKSDHGYSGPNRTSWEHGYEYCKAFLRGVVSGWVHPWMTQAATDIVVCQKQDSLTVGQVEMVISEAFTKSLGTPQPPVPELQELIDAARDLCTSGYSNERMKRLRTAGEKWDAADTKVRSTGAQPPF